MLSKMELKGIYLYKQETNVKNSSKTIVTCYRLYKPDSTDGQKRVRLAQHQCTKGGTDGTSEAMGRGVAESHR